MISFSVILAYMDCISLNASSMSISVIVSGTSSCPRSSLDSLSSAWFHRSLAIFEGLTDGLGFEITEEYSFPDFAEVSELSARFEAARLPMLGVAALNRSSLVILTKQDVQYACICTGFIDFLFL